MKKLVIPIVSLLILASTSHAGVIEMTHASRANCGNNESVTWDLRYYFDSWVNSEHFNAKNGRLVHAMSSGWAFNYRNGQVHWGESFGGGWLVRGTHWLKNSKGKPVEAKRQLVSDCNLYDGWWDH